MFWSLNSRVATTWLIKRTIEAKFPGTEVKALTIRQQQFDFPSRLTLKNLAILVKDKQETRDIGIDTVEFNHLPQIILRQKPVEFHVKKAQIKSETINVEDLYSKLNILFKGSRYLLGGDLQIVKLRLASFTVTGIFSMVESDGKNLHLTDCFAKSYGGTIACEIFLEYQAGLPYSIQLNAARLNLQKLKEVNSAFFQIFSQVEGQFEGEMRLKGDKEGLKTFFVNGRVPKNAKVPAGLFSFVAQLLPNSTQKDMLNSLGKSGGKVPMEVLSVNLQSLNEQELRAIIKMSSRQLNLDLNPTIDVRLDGKLESLFSSVKGE